MHGAAGETLIEQRVGARQQQLLRIADLETRAVGMARAKKRDLLYVSDRPYGSTTFLCIVPQGKLKGKLTGFNEPSDKAGTSSSPTRSVADT